MSSTDPPRHYPAVAAHHAGSAADIQLRIADAITKFAGSMTFVYLHAAAFVGWMLFVESNPWPTLTLVVSLEAIFLSTFVMIGQNRQASFQQAKADHDFVQSELELKTNTELTRAIHAMTTELHSRLPRDQIVAEPVPRSSSNAVAEPSATSRATSDSSRLWLRAWPRSSTNASSS